MAMPSISMTKRQEETVGRAQGCVLAGSDAHMPADPVYSVTLSVSNLAKSLQYWNHLLGMKVYSQSDTNAILGYADDQVFNIWCSL